MSTSDLQGIVGGVSIFGVTGGECGEGEVMLRSTFNHSVLMPADDAIEIARRMITTAEWAKAKTKAEKSGFSVDLDLAAQCLRSGKPLASDPQEQGSSGFSADQVRDASQRIAQATDDAKNVRPEELKSVLEQVDQAKDIVAKQSYTLAEIEEALKWWELFGQSDPDFHEVPGPLHDCGDHGHDFGKELSVLFSKVGVHSDCRYVEVKDSVIYQTCKRCGGMWPYRPSFAGHFTVLKDSDDAS